MTNRIPGDERWRRELSELLTRIETINRPLTRPLSPSEGAGTGTANEISPVARPHGQALNLDPNRNLARLRFLEIKSKITIKIGKKPFRLNSMAVPSEGERVPEGRVRGAVFDARFWNRGGYP